MSSVFQAILLDHARGCLYIFRRFLRARASLYLPTRARFRIFCARVCVRAVNVRGSLIVSRTSASTIDLSHAKRQIAARRSPDFASESRRKEKILFLFLFLKRRGEWKRGELCARADRPLVRIARSRDSTYLVSFNPVGSPERLRRKWNQ